MPAATEPRYEYGPTPNQPLTRSDLTSVALGPADAAHVIQLLHENQDAEAAQYYQSKVGGTLAEARDAIGAIQEGLRDAAAPRGAVGALAPRDLDDLPDVRRYLESGNRLEAVHAYRVATGAGLREAMAAVDRFERQLRQGTGALTSSGFGASSGYAASPAAVGPISRRKPCLPGCAAFLLVAVVIAAIPFAILFSASRYVQATAIYRCSVPAIQAELVSQELLAAPIHEAALIFVPHYQPAADASVWTFNAEYYALDWGGNGWGIVDAHLSDTSTGANTVSARIYKEGRWHAVLPAGQIACIL